MMTSPTPLVRDLVLIGGGHSHALVLRDWGMAPMPGVRLTLIDPEPTAPYTGMLPGFVAGHYDREDLDYDLAALCRHAGARLILGRAQEIDLERREIAVEGRPGIRYDRASINVGITSALPDVPGFSAHAVAAKPLGPFAVSWTVAMADGVSRACIIGGGVGGVELALAMDHAIRAAGRSPQITVLDRSAAMSGVAPWPRRRLLRRLARQKIELIDEVTVVRLEPRAVCLEDGRRIDSDFTVSAAGARPFGWLENTGLDLTDGFLTVGPGLRTSDPAVFAAGDCAHLSHAPRPKAGVFAVRAAPILFDNLRASLRGEALRALRPQKRYLKLISLGRKEALVDKWGLALDGDWAWHWKDRIDRAFMGRLTDLPSMAPLPGSPFTVEGETKPLCGGCGSKVGGDILDQVLAALPATPRGDVELTPGDDAAILRLGGTRQVITTDHLRSFWDDAHVMARIAAVHALGDIWAMGAEPQAALAQITLPRMSQPLQEATLFEIMAAAAEVFAEVGAAIIGGHTTQGAETILGFTVTGLAASPITQSGAQPGQALVLTRPIGSGVLMAGAMAGMASGGDVARAIEMMAAPQAEMARRLAPVASAMTDVTGFGLAGHAFRIARASGVAIELDLRAVPFLPGALDLAGAGVRSTLWSHNVAAVPGAAPASPREDLMFDPQTSGGLLACLDGDAARAVTRSSDARIIGTCRPGPAALTFAQSGQ